MKIILDIGHPAHVHYFRNFIKIMESEGHQFLVTARNKEIEHELLEYYEIPFIGRGGDTHGLLEKILYLFYADVKLYRLAKQFKPDLALSFDSTYLAHASKLLNIPHIIFDDTEHATLEHSLSFPFCDVILTPSCYTKNLGRKQLRFDGYMELCHLHPNYYSPDPEIYSLLGIDRSEQYTLIRFVSWNAAHDIGQKGLTLQKKRELVRQLSKKLQVFISSEAELPDDLKPYEINIPVYKMHDAINYSSLFISEGATMVTESAILGTPAIFVNSLDLGNIFEEEHNYRLIFRITDPEKLIAKSLELIEMNEGREEFQKRRQNMLDNKIDVTAFMLWFVKKFPESFTIMKSNPGYQRCFH